MKVLKALVVILMTTLFVMLLVAVLKKANEPLVPKTTMDEYSKPVLQLLNAAGQGFARVPADRLDAWIAANWNSVRIVSWAAESERVDYCNPTTHYRIVYEPVPAK